MAEAPLYSSTYEHTDSQPDALTLRLRSAGPVGIDELINLYRATSPAPVESSSSGTRTPTAFGSRKESTATKPTSAGTSYPVEGYAGKGKATATYASSLGATQGSASEAEAEMDATRDNALVGVGHWMVEGGAIVAPPLKGSARARKRQRVNSRSKHKKPPVVIFQHRSTACASSDDDECPTVAKPEDRRNSKDVKYLRYRRSEPAHNNQLLRAEEGRLSAASTLASPSASLSGARFYVVISLVIAIVLTFALSAFAAYHTGKMRMACTKGIIFAASVLMSCFTVLAMIVARHTLQTALLAGLLEFLVGFGLVVEVHDFMA